MQNSPSLNERSFSIILAVPFRLIGKPVFCLLCALWIFRLFPEDFPIPSGFPEFFRTAVQILILSAAYFLLLLFFHRKPQRSAA